MNEITKATFAPQLYIKNGVKDIDFYTKAFGAVELRRWANDDESMSNFFIFSSGFFV